MIKILNIYEDTQVYDVKSASLSLLQQLFFNLYIISIYFIPFKLIGFSLRGIFGEIGNKAANNWKKYFNSHLRKTRFCRNVYLSFIG